MLMASRRRGWQVALSSIAGAGHARAFSEGKPVQISQARLEEFVKAELTVFARRAKNPTQPLRLLEILRASSSVDKVARLVHEELPVRFARRLKHIERVEGWSGIPELVALHDMHVRSFQELRLADPGDVQSFPETIFAIRQRHKRIAPLFAEAVRRVDEGRIGEPRVGDLVEQEDTECPVSRHAVVRWAETFLRSRVSTEMLMAHYVACIGASEDNYPSKGDSSTKIGIIDTECDPWDICKQVIAEVQDGPWPCLIEAENRSPKNFVFSHAPRYLFYIVEELLTNSARATAEGSLYSDAAADNPINVALCADSQQVVIRISDRGGGMPGVAAKQMWSPGFSTSLETPDDLLTPVGQPDRPWAAGEQRPWGVFSGHSPISGRGVGLPLSRLYAMYLGGFLNIINLPGLGVDAYLFLNRIDPYEIHTQAASDA